MSKNIFAISDTWFNRPIGDKSDLTVSEYNNEIINIWNKTVNKTDDVYILGGFGISELYPIATKLNGTLHFLNNYFTSDEKDFFENLKICINNCIDKKVKNKFRFEDNQIITLNDEDVVLSYFPLSYWYGKDSGTLCLHGLTEDSNFKEGNISCHSLKNNLKPLNIRELKEKINDFEFRMI